MTKEDLIEHCRYYKGEDENPFKPEDGGENQNKMMLWFYEQCWVISTLQFERGMRNENLSEYISYGLTDFSKFDNTPITLKALLFNRYAKDCYSMREAVDSFKDFYLKYYA